VFAKADLIDRLSTLITADESVAMTAVAQVKGGMKKQLGKSLIKGAVAGLAVTAATGGTAGLLVVAVPPSVWVVVTSQRLLLIERTHGGKRLGDLVFDAPLQALTASLKGGLINQVTIADRSDGQSLLRLNLGVKGKVAKEIVTSIER
jgi:hypothetical protein